MVKRALVIVLSLIVYVAAAGFFAVKIGESMETAETVAYSRGSRGEIVKVIQERLAALELYNGALDGVFGPATQRAVVEFQIKKGLVPDGIVGDITLEALGIVSSEAIYDDELYLLASIIYGEGRGEPYEGQVAIGAVVLNRVESERFPNSVYEVIFQNGAFSAVNDGQIYLGVDENAINAAKDALDGADPTGGALYYWNPATATSQWIWSIPVETAIGRHVFGGSGL